MNVRADINITKAAKMWVDGLSAGMIAAQFGVSRNVVIGIANRNRKLFPNKAKTGIKKENRLLPAKKVISPEERKRQNEAQNAKRRAARQKFLSVISDAGNVSEQIREEREKNAAQRRKRGFTAVNDLALQYTARPLHELEACHCRWPVNDGGPYLFCASVTAEDSSYCPRHLERSLPAKPERRVAP